MGDANPIRTLRDYSKPSHEGYRNTIELPVGNNMVPLRSDTIRLVQNGCSFHGLRFEDPNQHLKDFLKLVDLLDLDGTTFEARVWDYMAAHTERMERFKNAIFKQREEINDRRAEMFRLLKELTTSRAPKKVLIREEATKTETEVAVKEAKTKNGAENKTKNKQIKKAEKEEAVEASNSQPIDYYLKHMINEKLIKGLIDNHRKEDIRGNFEIPCNIGGLKHMNALVDQGSDVNVMPLSTYMKLTDERPTETDIRLSLASHSYIYPLGIAEDVLVKVYEHVYPVDFIILDIKENEKSPFILGTPFSTTAKC
ncbi:MAK10-like protein [Tanacetum coccineum]